LLTNAHVVDLNASDLAQRPDLLATTFSDSLATITAQLGARLPDEAQAKAARVIFVALYSNHMMTAEPKDVKIELFTKVPTFPKMELRLSGPVLSKDLEHGIPVRIIAKGKVYPGRDVAVLKTARSDDGALDKDKLICLRLGDSDDVRPGAHLQSFGFPGAAFRPEIMPDNARRLVSCQNGQLGQIKPLRGEMPVIFEITNDIHHGDSGGPIIDKHGHVIALNVAGYPLKPGDGDLTLPGHNVAIPINVVKPFLKAAGIEMLDPGPLTECWERGLRLYAAEDYAGAEKEFAELLRLETGKWLSALDRLTGSDGIDGSGNAYAHDLYVLCQKKQGKLKLPARN
jgi:hypothetical protein